MSYEIKDCQGYNSVKPYYYCIKDKKVSCSLCNNKKHRDCNSASIELSEDYYICDDFIEDKGVDQTKFSKGICDLKIPKRKCNDCKQVFCLFTFDNTKLKENNHEEIHKILKLTNKIDIMNSEKTESDDKVKCKSRCHQETENSSEDNKSRYEEHIKLFSGDEFFQTQIICDMLEKFDEKDKDTNYTILLNNNLFFTDEKFVLSYVLKDQHNSIFHKSNNDNKNEKAKLQLYEKLSK